MPEPNSNFPQLLPFSHRGRTYNKNVIYDAAEPVVSFCNWKAVTKFVRQKKPVIKIKGYRH